jgi:hypothetical protein
MFKLPTMFVLYINSSVNFIIFYFFVPDFRNLFHKRLDSLLGRKTEVADAPPSDFTRTFPFPERQGQLGTSQLNPTRVTGLETDHLDTEQINTTRVTGIEEV